MYAHVCLMIVSYRCVWICAHTNTAEGSCIGFMIFVPSLCDGEERSDGEEVGACVQSQRPSQDLSCDFWLRSQHGVTQPRAATATVL